MHTTIGRILVLLVMIPCGFFGGLAFFVLLSGMGIPAPTAIGGAVVIVSIVFVSMFVLRQVTINIYYSVLLAKRNKAYAMQVIPILRMVAECNRNAAYWQEMASQHLRAELDDPSLLDVISWSPAYYDSDRGYRPDDLSEFLPPELLLEYEAGLSRQDRLSDGLVKLELACRVRNKYGALERKVYAFALSPHGIKSCFDLKERKQQRLDASRHASLEASLVAAAAASQEAADAGRLAAASSRELAEIERERERREHLRRLGFD